MRTKVLCLLLLLIVPDFGQELRGRNSQPDSTEPGPRGGGPDTNLPVSEKIDETPSVTHHEIMIGGKTLSYTATAAEMPILNASGETEAHMFYVAYTLDGQTPRDGQTNAARRPLTFSFNGGPGSASVWVHMGAFGPKRAKLMDNGDMPPPPYQLVDNEDTLLDQTDLVFIDAIGTGFSRAKTPELARKYEGVQGDLQSFSEFIRMYLTHNSRWLRMPGRQDMLARVGLRLCEAASGDFLPDGGDPVTGWLAGSLTPERHSEAIGVLCEGYGLAAPVPRRREAKQSSWH